MTNEEAREILSKINISVGLGESFNLSENQILEATSMAIKALEQQPKSGKWIDIDATHSQCDKCLAVFEIVSANGEANFCPNCGADMRGEKNGE